MSELVIVKSDDNLSRETVKLLVEMKHHLQRHGIAIKLAEPDIISSMLQASESIDDEVVDRCRKRLKGLAPHAGSPRRVYLFSTTIGRITCGQCRQAMNVRVHHKACISNPQAISCPCGEVLYIGKQARQYARKPTHLPGTFAVERDDSIIGDMIVENISYEGVRLRLKTLSDQIREDDVLLIQFVLDNKYHTQVCEPVDVRYIRDDVVGAQFQNAYGMTKPLIEYLRS